MPTNQEIKLPPSKLGYEDGRCNFPKSKGVNK